MLGNCDYVVELAKQLKLSMVGIGGKGCISNKFIFLNQVPT